MLTLDGSQGEGGGQMVRTALALSALTQIPFRMTDIRAGRDVPGLKAQHVTCVRALEKLCGAISEGAELGSRELTFHPKPIKGGVFELDIGTAGSITLLLQSILLPALFANRPSRLTIIGGTDVDWAMPIDYFIEVLAPHLRQWCEKLEVKVLKRGYHPTGGGRVEVFIKPRIKRMDFETFDPFLAELRGTIKRFSLLEQGHLIAIRGVSHCSKDLEAAQVATRQAHAAQAVLSRFGDVRIRSEYADSACTGSGITLWALYSNIKDETNPSWSVRLGADALGKKGIPAEQTGKTAAERLSEAIASPAPVDRHLADNLVPFLALAEGTIKAESITQHTTTNIDVIKAFLGTQFYIKENVITTTPRA
ncbi:RNA 3'-terminal phosphate cyclase [Candidatus Woesearchaeota archaeon]|nr:RNA 3'-terminal phosphate cyclase [Candidatus Woesearchaeota archaeon]